MSEYLKNKICILFIIILFLPVSEINAKTEEIEIPRNTFTEEEIALQKIALAEAGNTTVWDMALVMQVVLNRVESDKFPNTVEEVIKQSGQFSTYPHVYNKKEPNFNSSEALRIVKSGKMVNHGELFFENTYTGSWISTHKQFLFKHGNHSFYK